MYFLYILTICPVIKSVILLYVFTSYNLRYSRKCANGLLNTNFPLRKSILSNFWKYDILKKSITKYSRYFFPDIPPSDDFKFSNI